MGTEGHNVMACLLLTMAEDTCLAPDPSFAQWSEILTPQFKLLLQWGWGKGEWHPTRTSVLPRKDL